MILEAASTVLFLRAADYSLATLNDPARLLHAGALHADLLWLASVLDMLGYLAAIPVAFYLRERFRGEPGSDLFTLAGVAFMLLGAAAAIAFAVAGPQLIREYAASPSGRFATLKAFETLYRIVFYGVWQTLDAALAGVWALGIARLAQKHQATTLALVLLALGAAAGAVAIARVSGVLPAA